MSSPKQQLRRDIGKLSKRKMLELIYGLEIEILKQIGQLKQDIAALREKKHD